MKKYLVCLISLVSIFLFTNKVNALETVNISWLNDTPAHVASDSTYQELARGTHNIVYRNRDTGYYAICFTTGDNTCEVFNPSDYFTFTNVGIADYGSSDGDNIGLWFTNNGDLPKMNSGSSFRANFQTETFEVKVYQISHIRTYSNILQPGENGQGFSGYRTYYNYYSNVSWTPYSGKTSTLIEFLPPTGPSEINFSENLVSENDYNGISHITMSELTVNFDIFDTTNYTYQFALDSPNNGWETIGINDYTINVSYNTTVYIRVIDSNNNVIISSNRTITGIYSEPYIDYKIEEGTNVGKKLTIGLHNLGQNDYIVIRNIQTGIEETLDRRELIIYDNLNLDSIFQVEVYDENDNFIMSKNITIVLDEINENKDRWIQVAYNSKRNAYLGNFFNTKKNDKCYYKFSNEERTELQCNNSFIIEKRDIQKNDYFDLLIYDKNNNLVLKKTINYTFNSNAPKFTFESYFNDDESKQVLKIIVDNLNNSDHLYYSLDNELWTELTNQRINYLDFYSDSEVYFKVERNNQIISKAFYHVIYKAYENSEMKEQKKGLEGFFETFTRIIGEITVAPLNKGKQVFNFLFNSKIGLYLNFILISSILIMIIKSMRR